LLERFVPGLDAALREIPLTVLEARGNPSIAIFKELKGPALLIPQRFGGLGATAPEGARVLRAVASRAPSLGIVCTMHNFSVSTLVEWAIFGEEQGEALLAGLADNSMYVASGFAEGRSAARPLDMHMKARRAPGGGWLISGSKKPCTITHSMDFLSCGLSVEVEPGSWCRGVGMVPADSAGIERRPFWKSHILAGAESDEVILRDVHVPDDFVFVVEDAGALDPVEVTGYIWLQIALTSTYLGIVSGLVERVLASGKGPVEERGLLVAQVEAMAAAVDGVAYGLDAGEDRQALLARALSTRMTAQTIIETIAMRASELLGGMAFLGSSDIAYLLAASRAMAFHPPGRVLAAKALNEGAQGGAMDLC
jgi:alkylation response protein AidB-like acyl-CoA dehydrogenase